LKFTVVLKLLIILYVGFWKGRHTLSSDRTYITDEFQFLGYNVVYCLKLSRRFGVASLTKHQLSSNYTALYHKRRNPP
jgi:hypothetical protein